MPLAISACGALGSSGWDSAAERGAGRAETAITVNAGSNAQRTPRSKQWVVDENAGLREICMVNISGTPGNRSKHPRQLGQGLFTSHGHSGGHGKSNSVAAATFSGA